VTSRSADGSAGDADYGKIGAGYATYRQPDSRIAARIHAALGPARTVLNVGAGAGSYEPIDRAVIAVDPSASMRAQRPSHLPPAVDATAEQLPFPDRQFDASMATFTVHQWSDLRTGLAGSGWSFVPASAVERFVATLRRNLSDGTWDARYGRFRKQPEFDGPLRLVVDEGSV
jgi:hypothetical protein